MDTPDCFYPPDTHTRHEAIPEGNNYTHTQVILPYSSAAQPRGHTLPHSAINIDSKATDFSSAIKQQHQQQYDATTYSYHDTGGTDRGRGGGNRGTTIMEEEEHSSAHTGIGISGGYQTAEQVNAAMLARDLSPTFTLSIPNLDSFFCKIYRYYCDQGFYPTLTKQLTNLCTLGFTIVFSTFLFLNIDWHAVVTCHSEQSCANVQVITWTAYTDPSGWHTVIWCYFVVFVLYWCWSLLSSIQLIHDAHDMSYIYHTYLHIIDTQLSQLSWSSVLDCIVNLQATTRLSIPRDLTALDITNRMMRKENFLIALINEGIIDLQLPSLWNALSQVVYIPYLQGRYSSINSVHATSTPSAVATQSSSTSHGASSTHTSTSSSGNSSSTSSTASNTSWITPNFLFGTLFDNLLQLCILSPMFSSNFTLSSSYTGSNGVYALQKRFIYVGLLTLLFTPFLFIYLVIFFILRHAEELSSKKTTLLPQSSSSSPSASSSPQHSTSNREWNCWSHWLYREYNEVSHFYTQRMATAHEHAAVYLEQFPHPIVSTIATGVSYCAGAIVGVLLLMTVLGSDVLNAKIDERPILWYIAIFSAILAISRSFIQNHNVPITPQPTLHMQKLINTIHYAPDSWKQQAASSSTAHEVSSLFHTRLMAFVCELTSLLLTPYLFMFWLPRQAAGIVTFVEQHSIEVNGVGCVCSYARFDMKSIRLNHHNHNQKRPHTIALPQQQQQQQQQQPSKGGKLEKSFLSFCINHPHWPIHDTGEVKEGMTGREEVRVHRDREAFLLSLARELNESVMMEQWIQYQKQNALAGTMQQQPSSAEFVLRRGKDSVSTKKRRSSSDRSDTLWQTGSSRPSTLDQDERKEFPANTQREQQLDADDFYAEHSENDPESEADAHSDVDDDHDDHGARRRHHPQASPTSPSSPSLPTLSRSDQHLIQSFADLLKRDLRVSNSSIHTTTTTGAMTSSSGHVGAGRSAASPVSLSASLLPVLPAYVMPDSMASAAVTDELLQSSCVGEVRERMFAALEQRVEQQQQQQQELQQQQQQAEEQSWPGAVQERSASSPVEREMRPIRY